MLNYTVFENYPYNADATKLFGGTTYVCQTFTPGTAHTIYVVQVELIRVGSCGTVTLNIYATDSNGKPTGSSLATATVAQSSVGTSAAMVDFTLNSSLRVDNSKYAIVLSAAGVLGTIGWRYKTTGAYTAGSIFSSTDSGATWAETSASDFMFKEWGIPLPLYGATKIQLYPRKAGSFTQLQPYRYNNNQNNTVVPDVPANWECVNELADAPNEYEDYVCFNASGPIGNETVDSWILSGSSESVAGTLSGTSVLWRVGIAGITGVDTSFTSLTVGDLLRSPTKNEFHKYPHRCVGEVASIESDTGLTFATPFTGVFGFDYVDDSVGATQNPNTLWYFTPNSLATTDKYLAEDGGTHLRHNMKYLTGTWTFTKNSKLVTGSGGAALTELVPWAYVRREGFTTGDMSVDYVVDDNTFYLDTAFDHPTATYNPNMCQYCSYSWLDDLTDEDLATMWCSKTKKDSYLLKNTLANGDIRQVEVVFRVCFYNKANVEEYYPSSVTSQLVSLKSYLVESASFIFLYKTNISTELSNLKTALNTLVSSYPSLATKVTATNAKIDSTIALVTAFVDDKAGLLVSYDDMLSSLTDTMIYYANLTTIKPTATAQPFLYLNSTASDGTEITISPAMLSVSANTKEEDFYSFTTYRQIISRPGGGVFTKDDLNELEVGIILGNVSDFRWPNRVICTQIYVEPSISQGDVNILTEGLTQYGFRVFSNGLDEWGLPAFNNGMNLYTHKIYRLPSSIIPFFARPVQVLRDITTRFLGRRKTTASPRRSNTSGSMTQ